MNKTSIIKNNTNVSYWEYNTHLNCIFSNFLFVRRLQKE